MNKVEIFTAEKPFELERYINEWNKTQEQEPTSVSISYANGEYIAAVVVKEAE